MSDRVVTARSALFTPGTRPDRFARARDSGADLLVLDLEDSVRPGDKAAARQGVAAWLVHDRRAMVRVNGADSEHHLHDLAMVRAAGSDVMLPKAESVEGVERVRSSMAPGASLVVLIETAKGVLDVRDICASGAVARVCFGSVDLATELSIAHTDSPALTQARVALVLASAAAGLPPPLDGVTTALDDAAALASDIARARLLGLAGKLAIHPRQVAAINHGFAPTSEELAWARSVLASGSGDGVGSADGHMIDRPVLERARRLLAQTHPSTNGDPS